MISQSKRNPYFDTLKALLIFLVVFGHTLELFPFTPAIRATSSFIYSFHMPLFIFVSGFFARWNPKRLAGCLIVFFAFSALQLTLAAPKLYTLTELCHLFAYPRWGAWFLIAYAAYLGSLKLFKKVKIQ